MLQVSGHPDSTRPKPSLGAKCLIYPSLQHPGDEGETEGRSCLLSQGSEGKERGLKSVSGSLVKVTT